MLSGHRILITGVTGRIGGAIAAALAPTNTVIGLARYGRVGALDDVKSLGVTPVIGDFARGSLDDVPHNVDYVLHVAADIRPASAVDGMIDNADGAARLMGHCRAARAFLHVSASSVYAQNADPYHVYPESSDLGGGFGGQYSATKLAGEGAVRAAAALLNLPTIICRQNVQYGGLGVDAGLIDRFLDHFVETGEVYLPLEGPLIIGPIHEDDIVSLVEPSLAAAAVPAHILNWGGDELVDWQELFDFVGDLIGKSPKFIRKAEFNFPNYYPDPTARRALTGPCKVSWRDGIRRTLELRHPGIALTALTEQ
ncbi:NAD(P)-dependent oxidoreductase (plasmid) [Sphingomonas paeninsulae]|uniref:NAD(P)-dependent oxidoreductase n=1 Tax=Sphingomonas paeninsulae TaxID=2319844 RepID=A0A494TDF7_SPHPE|nr:NAD(P)-dependent oxidoreductase [Sphingomonas paeninsulae]AYJ85294.1 NAD(P)-dependent oxidoreductase [Sphingomonas paeninsulae]